MSEKVRSGATYEDVLSAPEDRIAEVVAGDLYLSPRPAVRHARILSVLGADLIDGFDRGRSGPGGWWILHEVELHLFGDVLVPDLAGWRREKVPRIPDAPAMEIAPDWICEVLSPSSEGFDREQKMPRYAHAEVGHLWLIDIPRRRLEVYSRAGAAFVRMESYDGNAPVSAPPFEGVAIDLARIW